MGSDLLRDVFIKPSEEMQLSRLLRRDSRGNALSDSWHLDMAA